MPATFGTHGLVVGLIDPGGDGAIRKAVEFAHRTIRTGMEGPAGSTTSEKDDSVVGIAASGTTPTHRRTEACNTNSVLHRLHHPQPRQPSGEGGHPPGGGGRGPGVRHGSTRMKSSGTARSSCCSAPALMIEARSA